MELLIVGMGPGDPKLVTVAGLEALKAATLVVVPQTVKTDGTLLPLGRAEEMVVFHRPDAPLMKVPVPMTRDAAKRDAGFIAELKKSEDRWKGHRQILLPVLGDPMLYATTTYLARCWAKLCPIEVRVIPGVSAHSYLASSLNVDLALDDEIFSVIPGSAPREKVRAMLEHSTVAACYKTASHKDFGDLIKETGPWKIWRGDDLATPNQVIIEGEEALVDVRPYMSTFLLRKDGDHDA